MVINDTLYVTININFQNNRKFNSFINDNIDELMVGFKEYLSPDEIEKLREILSLWKLCFDHDNRKNMRSEFSKLSKELLIEIIEKGFSFEDLKLSDLKKKEKEVQKVIKKRKEYIFNRIKNIKISEYAEVRDISNTYISICKSCDGYDTEINANALYVTINHIFQNSRKIKSFINDIDELMVGCKEYLSEDEVEKVKEILLMLKGSIW